MRRDFLAWAALSMAIVGTATAEYHLAAEAGWGPAAFALPGALDIYVIRALRAHRDMVTAALVMFAANAASHLVSAGQLAVSWGLVVGVSALPILVLVRVHALRETAPEPAAELPEPTPLPEPVPVAVERADEPSKIDNVHPAPLVFGPLVPVAELLAGTGPEQGGFKPDVIQPEPEPGPEPDPVPPAADEVPPGVPVDHIEAVRRWLAAEPHLTGTAIGTRLGTSDSYGRRVRRAALA